ncbi:MAG TPA: sulfurtransferase [Methylophilaceae bacterium]|nr:sulfurtransferase [Methylophilaceae bacterium]HAJ72676.1 sulfurtransferase [Methylophilaceae bacterium]
MGVFQDIEATDLFTLISQPKVLVVDVRNDDEVAKGRIPNAIHIPLPLLPIEYTKLTDASHVVFYCHSGIRSALAADFAISKGIKSVYNLTGGIIAWSQAGYSLVLK